MSLRWEDCDIERIRFLDHHRTTVTERLPEIMALDMDEDNEWFEVIGYVVREDPKWVVVMERWDNIEFLGQFNFIFKPAIIERVVLVERHGGVRKRRPRIRLPKTKGG